jgi:hypothetical protein
MVTRQASLRMGKYLTRGGVKEAPRDYFHREVEAEQWIRSTRRGRSTASIYPSELQALALLRSVGLCWSAMLRLSRSGLSSGVMLA